MRRPSYDTALRAGWLLVAITAAIVVPLRIAEIHAAYVALHATPSLPRS